MTGFEWFLFFFFAVIAWPHDSSESDQEVYILLIIALIFLRLFGN